MSVIRLVCPKGHVLRVDSKHAGRTGTCQYCGTRIKIPEQRRIPVSEDEVLDFLGDEGPGSSNILTQTAPPSLESFADEPSASSTGPPKKSCSKCHQQIEATIHICPHCHTYIATISEMQ